MTPNSSFEGRRRPLVDKTLERQKITRGAASLAIRSLWRAVARGALCGDIFLFVIPRDLIAL